MNRKGFSTLDSVVCLAVIGVLIMILLPAIQATRNALIQEERQKIRKAYQDRYEEALRNAVNWLLNDPQGPLSERDRGQFLGSIKSGIGTTRIKHEGAIAAFAALDWPHAKTSKKLCDRMAGFIGLMETAEGPYKTFAQEEFDETHATLQELIPK